MYWLIGTDEAGYGPNLGPLVVTATLWGIDSETSNEFPNTAPPVRKTPSFFDDSLPSDAAALFIPDPFRAAAWLNRETDPLCARHGVFPVFDSKKLYHASGSFAPLERSVLIALNMIFPEQPDSFALDDLLKRIVIDDTPPFWENKFNPLLPVADSTSTSDSFRQNAALVADSFAEKRFGLVNVRSKRVFPQEFNHLLSTGLKSDLLAQTTFHLAFSFIKDLTGNRNTASGLLVPDTHSDTIVVLCDKIGGRNHYYSLIAPFFNQETIEIVSETAQVSIYRLLWKGIPVEIRFQMKGESNRPTALASLFSKYLRELSMIAWNQFWCQRVNDLRPTAGYPQDAIRYWNDIADKVKELNIDRCILWRNK